MSNTLNKTTIDWTALTVDSADFLHEMFGLVFIISNGCLIGLSNEVPENK